MALACVADDDRAVEIQSRHPVVIMPRPTTTTPSPYYQTLPTEMTSPDSSTLQYPDSSSMNMKQPMELEVRYIKPLTILQGTIHPAEINLIGSQGPLI